MNVWLPVVTIMGLGVLSTAKAQVLDQSQEVQDGGISVNNNEHTAQGIAQGAGLPYLAEIWVGDFVHPGDTYPLDITLEIRGGVGVDPTGLGLIHSADFALTEAPSDGWHKFVYPAPVALVPGNNYTFVLKGAAGNTGTTVMGLNKVDSYGGTGLILSTSATGGASWSAPGGFTYDLRFRTYSRADFPLVLDQATVQDSASPCTSPQGLVTASGASFHSVASVMLSLASAMLSRSPGPSAGRAIAGSARERAPPARAPRGPAPDSGSGRAGPPPARTSRRRNR